MPYTRANSLKGTGRKTGRSRRRTSQISKVKYQRPTAANQKRQLLRNTRLLNKVAKIQADRRVYTDWQYGGTLNPTVSDAWKVTPLTDFALWEPVLRQDEVSESSSSTYIRNMQLNLRFTLNEKDYAYISCFVVTMRRNSSGINPFTTPPAPIKHYITGTGVVGSNIRLNPAIYKVHWCKYMTLTKNSLLHASIAEDTVGNPNTTWRKVQVNLPLKMKVTNPSLFITSEGAWTHIPYTNLPYYQRYFLMSYIHYSGSGDGVPVVGYDALSTAINSM